MPKIKRKRPFPTRPPAKKRKESSEDPNVLSEELSASITSVSSPMAYSASCKFPILHPYSKNVGDILQSRVGLVEGGDTTSVSESHGQSCVHIGTLSVRLMSSGSLNMGGVFKEASSKLSLGFTSLFDIRLKVGEERVWLIPTVTEPRLTLAACESFTGKSSATMSFFLPESAGNEDGNVSTLEVEVWALPHMCTSEEPSDPYCRLSAEKRRHINTLLESLCPDFTFETKDSGWCDTSIL